jgi:hypothetical protein
MNRLLLVFPTLWLATVPAMAAQAPINSKAELAKYLRDTPTGTSPLDRLSPGGRKRFLAQLVFGERGLRGFSSEDPQSELTHPQIVQLLALFGAESYAQGDGVTPARQAQLERERAAEAATRGCAVRTCPESEIGQRYDELVMWKPDAPLPDTERFVRVSQHYDRLFASYQSPEHLPAVSPPDLRLLKRAADRAVSYLPDKAHIAQLQRDLAVMQRRDMTENKDYQGLYEAMIATRQFATAEALARQHPGMDVALVPVLHEGSPLPQGWPTALTTSDQGRAMTRQAFDPSAPLRIVVVASCHFSQDAARAIQADAQLRPIFANDAIWLASQNESFGSVADWNRELPDQPIHVAWQDSEWSMLDSWAMPTFYVFRHGHLVKKFSGWHDLKTLKHSLREAGVLR